jgi:hypothetical protein
LTFKVLGFNVNLPEPTNRQTLVNIIVLIMDMLTSPSFL